MDTSGAESVNVKNHQGATGVGPMGTKLPGLRAGANQFGRGPLCRRNRRHLEPLVDRIRFQQRSTG